MTNKKNLTTQPVTFCEVSEWFNAQIRDLCEDSPLDREFRCTIFPSQQATSKEEASLTLKQLAKKILKTRAMSKKRLPWLNMGVFGEVRSKNNCLRHSDNLDACSGIEADYDAGELDPYKVANLLAAAGIAALIYTTPSHGHKGNRWRIVLVFSKEYSPKERARFLARLNGLFDGVFDQSCFDLSRSYYFGNAGKVTLAEGEPSVEGTPVQVFLVDGRYIDKANELDANAMFRGGGKEFRVTGEVQNKSPLEMSTLEAYRTLRRLDVATWCEPRDKWVKVGQACHHQFDGDETGYRLWCWFSKRSNKFDEDDQRRVWESFTGRSGNAFTFASLLYETRGARAQKSFKDLGPLSEYEQTEVGRSLAKDAIVDRLNREFAVVYVKGKAVHARWTLKEIDLGPVEALHTLFANERVARGRKTVPISLVWLEHPRRRTYQGIVFDPTRTNRDNILNLFRGWGLEALNGNCDLILNHIREVICDGNKDYFQYVMNWLADLVQNPGRKPGVALVLRGRKGAGKDTLALLMSRIVGRHHVAHIDKPDLLTQRFNAHFATALFVHVEEAFWAGDRSKKGPLQSLITAPTMSLERKGIDVITVDSFFRIFMTTNDDWAVPATEGERRYAVFDVSGHRAGDRDYFDKLYAEINGEGAAAFFGLLKEWPITDDVRKVPQTSALGDQKINSLTGMAWWWHETLFEGQIPTESFGGNDWQAGSIVVERKSFRALCADQLKDARHKGTPPSPEGFGKLLREMVPHVDERVRPRTNNPKRKRGYFLPKLDDCRAAFEKWLGVSIAWEDLDEKRR